MTDVKVFLDEPQLNDGDPRRAVLFHFYQEYLRDGNSESDRRLEVIGFAAYVLEHRAQFEEALTAWKLGPSP